MISTFEFADHVVGVLIKTDMDEHVFAEMRDIICEKIDQFGRISLFVEVEKGYGISFKALMKHLKFSVEQASNFEKVAVVAEQNWARNAMALKDLMISAQVKGFSNEDRLEALRWITE